MNIQAYILLGGIFGWDGPVTSDGMYGLARQLGAVPTVKVTTWIWGDYLDVAKAIVTGGDADKVAVIGYSGGGSRATWLANSPFDDRLPHIDLMVCYDPSPSWQMLPVHENVRKGICYYNENPMMPSPIGMLGGGRLTAVPGYGSPQILTRHISEQHLLVQFDQSLHAATVQAVKDLITDQAVKDLMS